MACRAELALCVKKGETFRKRFMWDNGKYLTDAITAINKSAPVQITASGHSLVTGWKAAVVSAGGMSEINCPSYPPNDDQMHPVTVVDSSNVEFDDVNSSGYTTYTSGGFLVYKQPFSLSGATATMNIRVSPQSGTVLKALTSSPAAGITVTDATKTIEVEFATAAETWSVGYFDLEVTLASGRIVEIATGSINIT